MRWAVASFLAVGLLACRSGAPHAPGEPAIPATPQRLPEAYLETPGAHAERPGKHSTTTGRHGTSGEVGGGVNTQSGAEAAPSEHPLLQEPED